MMSSPKLRIACLGASKVAGRILPRLRGSKHFEITGVAAQEFSRAIDFAGKHKIKQAFGSYNEALADQEVDAVYISTLNAGHAELSIRALQAGKHVLCEKPFALTAADAERILQTARDAGRVFQEGMMYRFFPAIQRVLDVAMSGALGDIRSVKASYCWTLHDLAILQGDAAPTSGRLSVQGGGGALHDTGCYSVDFVGAVMGSAQIKSIQAMARIKHGIDLYTTAQVEFENGKHATIEAGIDRAGFNVFEVQGTLGSIAYPRVDWTLGQTVRLYSMSEDGVQTYSDVMATDPFLPQFEAFTAACLNRAAPPFSNNSRLWNAQTIEKIRHRAGF